MKDFKKNCICNIIRKDKKQIVDIADWSTGPYVNLTMSYGSITAHSEDNASCAIRFCPFCGREFKNDK